MCAVLPRRRKASKANAAKQSNFGAQAAAVLPVDATLGDVVCWRRGVRGRNQQEIDNEVDEKEEVDHARNGKSDPTRGIQDRKRQKKMVCHFTY